MIDTLTLFNLSLIIIIASVCYSIKDKIGGGSIMTDYMLKYLYTPVIKIIKSHIPGKRAPRYFILIVTLFVYIVLLNFFSLTPYSNSVTSHFIFTLFLSLSIFCGIIITGILNIRSNFIKLFYPSGIHYALSNALIIIEILSFITRPFSLAIRLFANMLAGHTSLNIFGAFAIFISHNFTFIYIVPLCLCLSIILLEFGVSIIQAYVFTILVLIYISDITKINH